MKKIVVMCAFLVTLPALAVEYETQQASTGPLKIEITCPTTDFIGVASSLVIVGVTIETFTSNDPTQLIWGVWENDGSHTLLDDLIWEDTPPIDPSTSDAEYDSSSNTWTKFIYVVRDISSYELLDAQAEVYGWAEMTGPDYTAQTPDILVALVTDTTPPETEITSPSAGTYGSDITFEFTATDDYTGTGQFRFCYWLEPGESKPADPVFDTSATYTGLAAATYTFKVAAVDLASNEDPTPATVTVTVETISTPNVPTGPSSAVVDQQVTFTVSGAVSSEGHVLEYRFDFGDSTISAWSGSTSADHTYTSSGDYQVKAQARCPAHGVESAWSAPLAVKAGTPPTFVFSAVTTAQENVEYSYSPGVAGDPTPTVSASGLPVWLSWNGTTLSGTPGAVDVGTTGDITLTAANGVSPDATQVFQIVVSAKPSGGGGGGCSPAGALGTWPLCLLGLVLFLRRRSPLQGRRV